MPYPISRRTALFGGLAVAASAGGLYTATTALAGTGEVGAQAFQLRWSPNPAVDKLDAFAGVEDDRSHSHKGVQHIFADPAQYRFVMHVKDRDGSDRQRQEVRGMKAKGSRVDMHKNETWRYNYQMFIPDTLKGTTNFTHIFQVKHSGVGSPVVTVSLGRSGSKERIEMRMYGSGGATIGSTDLARLRNKWIDIEIEIKVADGKNGNLRFQIQDAGTTVVNASHSGDTWLGGNEAHPKWGIYRSIKDKGQLHDTYLLTRNMRAYQNQ
jgi:chitin-binding protein